MKREFLFKIDNKYSNVEIKWFLENVLKCSKNIISKLKQGDFILVNGKRENVRKKLLEGDEVRIIIPSQKSENILPNPDIKFRILYEDEDILVVDKPYGMPTHPSIHHYTDTLANGVCAYINSPDFTFHPVNRLDRETSGVVLLAKNMLSAHLLSKQLKEHKIEKTYYAITKNCPKEDSGTIIAPIARERESIIKRCVREDGKYAETLYKVIKSNGDKTLVMTKPVTGRTHQIRVHFAHIGCPLLGDRLYGTEILNERTRLHCKELTFIHPITEKKMTITSPEPDDFNIF